MEVETTTADSNPQPSYQEDLIIFNAIRDSLSKFIPEIARDYPILPAKKRWVNQSFLGYTHFKSKEVHPIVVKKIEICFEKNGERMELIRLIPTLLHEFAHEVREKTRDVSELSEIRKRKIDSHHDSHDPGFYTCFTKILLKAEELGIYTLPPKPNKFGLKSLKQFDKVDLAVVPLNFCGTSSYYKGENTLQRTNEILKIVVCDQSGKQKLIQLKEKTLKELYDQSSKRLNIKGKITKAETMKGELITEEYFQKIVSEYNGESMTVKVFK